MKLIELVVICFILVVFVKIFTESSFQLNEYRSERMYYLERTQDMLIKHGEMVHQVGGEK